MLCMFIASRMYKIVLPSPIQGVARPLYSTEGMFLTRNIEILK